LERSFVDTDNDDSRVMSSRSPQTESCIQGTLFNILKENKAWPVVAIDSGENEKCKSGQRDEEGQAKVDPYKRKLFKPGRPARRVFFLQCHK
jgi:hypothetical protein